MSLTNHSCSPNTARFSDGPLCVVRASRTINPGEEITDNYGEFYQVSSPDARKDRLRRQYYFECDCKACREDWPELGELRAATVILRCAGCSVGYSPQDLAKKKKCTKCKKDLKVRS